VQLGDTVAGVSAADGKLLWRYDKPATRCGSIFHADYHEGHVFAASAYGAAVDWPLIKKPTGEFTAEEVWSSKSMKSSRRRDPP